MFNLTLSTFLLFILIENDLLSLRSFQSAPVKPTSTISNKRPAIPASSKTKELQTEKFFRTINGRVSPGETFYSVLLNHGFSPPLVARLIETFKPVFDCRNIFPGDSYRLTTDAEGNLVNLKFQTSPVTIYRLRREGERLIPSKDKITLDKRIAKISGVIESSLFSALSKIGEKDQLAIDFADIFAWDIDFRHDLRRGDRFEIIFEKYYKDDSFIHYGKIVAAEYISRGRTLQAVYFKDPDGREDYYSPEGISVRRSFLRAPLRFTRISSGFSHRRFHPILKRPMPHLGIDFAAPIGTPVWSVADGVVTRKGWKNGNGNMVTIRHPNGYETMYNHLSRYGKGLKVGKRVKQKDIIGYVGTTGLSTGPHLDYRMKKNGKFINPLKEKFPAGLPVNKAYRTVFLKVSQQMTALLNEMDISSQKMVAGF